MAAEIVEKCVVWTRKLIPNIRPWLKCFHGELDYLPSMDVSKNIYVTGEEWTLINMHSEEYWMT